MNHVWCVVRYHDCSDRLMLSSHIVLIVRFIFSHLILYGIKLLQISDFGAARLVSHIRHQQASVPKNQSSSLSRSRSLTASSGGHLYIPLLETSSLMSKDVGTLLWQSPELLAYQSYGASTDVYRWSKISSAWWDSSKLVFLHDLSLHTLSFGVLHENHWTLSGISCTMKFVPMISSCSTVQTLLFVWVAASFSKDSERRCLCSAFVW